MANKCMDNDIIILEQLFTENKSIIHNTMQTIIAKKISIIKLKSMLHSSEVQKQKLKEYIKVMETIIRKSSNKNDLLVQHLNNTIEEVQNAIVNVKRAIVDLEIEKKNEIKPNKSNKKLVAQMKKILSECYNTNFDLSIQKENKLLELKNQTKDYHHNSYINTAKQELENYIKEYDILKSKNIHMKEMMSININQKI